MRAQQRVLRVGRQQRLSRRGALRARSTPARAEGGLDTVKERYASITQSIPPVVTAATVPVIAVSLLCKAATGHGLPGVLPGTIEGISFLVLPLGAGSLLPRLGEIAKGGDFSSEAVLKVLTASKSTFDDALGKDATERTAKIGAMNPNSQLAKQMADLEKRKAEKAKMSDEEIKKQEDIKKKLAAAALNVGQTISDTDTEESRKEDILARPVTETLKNCMTTENYDVDVTSFKDEDLDDKLNLATPEIESGAPKNNPGDAWREQYRIKEQQEQ
mmetsp:Transcript_19905/g.64801  ORF Transcript_19905/g.64801 Transcript_19905/m.64801 type:complete len:274 (+) Transcript_19905:33-854(+)